MFVQNCATSSSRHGRFDMENKDQGPSSTEPGALLEKPSFNLSVLHDMSCH